MRNSVLAISALAMPVALTCSPAAASVVQISAQGPVIEVGAAQVVQSAPDEAMISGGVTVRQQSAVAVMRENARRMDAVIQRLRAAGIVREDIQTSGISLNPAYQYQPDGRAPAFLGYDAINMVSIRLRNVGKVGETLDLMVAAGATNLNGPVFRRADESEARSLARKAAFEQARAQALDYAKLAGFRDVRLLGIDEAFIQSGPMDIIVTASRAVSAQTVSTPVEPGRIATSVQVTAKFELVR